MFTGIAIDAVDDLIRNSETNNISMKIDYVILMQSNRITKQIFYILLNNESCFNTNKTLFNWLFENYELNYYVFYNK